MVKKPCVLHVILSGTRSSKRPRKDERWSQKQEAFSKQDRGQRPAGKTSGAWLSSGDYSNEYNSARHKKWQCLEDCHLWFGHVEFGAKLLPRLPNDDKRCAAYRCFRTSSNDIEVNPTCFVKSFLVMKHGILSITRKRSTNAVSGCLRCPWGRRKQDSQS